MCMLVNILIFWSVYASLLKELCIFPVELNSTTFCLQWYHVHVIYMIFRFREKTRRLRLCFEIRFWVQYFHWYPVVWKFFILPVWAGSLSPGTRWGCICKGDGLALLDHYSLPSCAHAHCWTWTMLSGSRLLSQSLRKMLSLTVSFFSPTRTPHLEEAHKIKNKRNQKVRWEGLCNRWLTEWGVNFI